MRAHNCISNYKIITMASISATEECIAPEVTPDFRVVDIQGNIYGHRILIERVADVPGEYASQYVPIADTYTSNTVMIARSSWSLKHYLVHDPLGRLRDLPNQVLSVYIDTTDLSAVAVATWGDKEPADIWDGLMADKFDRGEGEKSKEAVFECAEDLMLSLREDGQLKFCEHLLSVNPEKYKGCADSLQHPDPVVADLAVNITTLAVQHRLAQIAGNELLRICKKRRTDCFELRSAP
jgi:hypothetical protein